MANASVFPASEEEMQHKVMFVKEMFERMGVPLFNDQILSMIDVKINKIVLCNFIYFTSIHTFGMYEKGGLNGT